MKTLNELTMTDVTDNLINRVIEDQGARDIELTKKEAKRLVIEALTYTIVVNEVINMVRNIQGQEPDW